MDRDEGIGLVEIVISMLLLSVVVLALLPALLQGLQYASAQSTTATATRFLSTLVEDARRLGDCGSIPTLFGRTSTDGRGGQLVSSGELDPYCGSGKAATLNLEVRQDGRVLVATIARIYIP